MLAQFSFTCLLNSAKKKTSSGQTLWKGLNQSKTYPYLPTAVCRQYAKLQTGLNCFSPFSSFSELYWEWPQFLEHPVKPWTWFPLLSEFNGWWNTVAQHIQALRKPYLPQDTNSSVSNLLVHLGKCKGRGQVLCCIILRMTELFDFSIWASI